MASRCSNIILPALKNTLVLTIAAVVIGKMIAISLGIFSAVRQYSIATMCSPRRLLLLIQCRRFGSG